jgi:hypothetical protein
MESVIFTFKGTVDLFVVRVNDRKLTFTNGEATTKLNENEQHTVQWFVRGAPGSNYTFAITEPKAAKFSHSATLDEDMKDAGVIWILLPEGEE